MDDIQEIVLLDKPKGVTSHSALTLLKQKIEKPKLKMGHAGTLDPNASGLLLVGVGQGTKRLKEYVGLSKTYEAEILLGVKTASGDVTGEVVEEQDVLDISTESMVAVLGDMVGVLRLPVPMFSAVKRGGRPLYKDAHAGRHVSTLPLRDMQVNSAVFLGNKQRDTKCIVHVRFNVESGVYIRSLVEEFGRRLGHLATLKNLRRTHVGDFSVYDEEVMRL